MWIQVHEMLVIEGGDLEQAKDEINAYNPLVPKGQDIGIRFHIRSKTTRETNTPCFGFSCNVNV
jgi:hypothetical protein